MCVVCFFLFQAEDGIRYLVRSRGLGDVYKRQHNNLYLISYQKKNGNGLQFTKEKTSASRVREKYTCLLYTSDAADERSSVDLGGRRIIKKKKRLKIMCAGMKKKRNRVQ